MSLFKDYLKEAKIDVKTVLTIKGLLPKVRAKLDTQLRDMGYNIEDVGTDYVSTSKYKGKELNSSDIEGLQSYLEEEGYMNESTLNEFSKFLKFLGDQPQGEELRKKMGDQEDRAAIKNKGDGEDDEEMDESNHPGMNASGPTAEELENIILAKYRITPEEAKYILKHKYHYSDKEISNL